MLRPDCAGFPSLCLRLLGIFEYVSEAHLPLTYRSSCLAVCTYGDFALKIANKSWTFADVNAVAEEFVL